VHVRIDMLILRLRKGRGRVSSSSSTSLPALCLGLLYGVYQMMQASVHMSSPGDGIPTPFIYLPMFIGFAMMSIYLGSSSWIISGRDPGKGGR